MFDTGTEPWITGDLTEGAPNSCFYMFETGENRVAKAPLGGLILMPFSAQKSQ